MKRDLINQPEHYKTHAVECIEAVRDMNFNRGNAVKYVWRAGAKGNEVEDLNKAIWYLVDEIHRLGGEVTADITRHAGQLADTAVKRGGNK